MDERSPPTVRPIGSFIEWDGPESARDLATISNIPGFPDWLRVRRDGRSTVFRVHDVAAFDETPLPKPQIILTSGHLVAVPGLSADAVLAAIAAAESTPAADPPPPPRPAGELAGRVLRRRAQVDGALAAMEAERGASAPSPAVPHLDLLLQHALALAADPAQTHPRDWLLLVRDALREAAVVAAAVDALADADALARTAEALEAAVPMLPPGRPPV